MRWRWASRLSTSGRQEAEHSTTIGGVATVTIIYEDADDLRQQFDNAIGNLLSTQ